MKKGIENVVIFALILALVLLGGPLLAIWAVNTLFGTGLGYTVTNWFAWLVLMALGSFSFK